MTNFEACKKSDLFITFKCNPKCKEITDNLCNNQTAYVCPELVAGAFNLKKQQLLSDVLHNGVFGKVVGNVQVVRQKMKQWRIVMNITNLCQLMHTNEFK